MHKVHAKLLINSLTRSKSPRLQGPFTVEELQRAIILISIHQHGKFSNKLHNLQQNQLLDSYSKILALNPMIDQDGLFRVGGQLRNAPLSYSPKHPILLSLHDFR